MAEKKKHTSFIHSLLIGSEGNKHFPFTNVSNLIGKKLVTTKYIKYYLLVSVIKL